MKPKWPFLVWLFQSRYPERPALPPVPHDWQPPSTIPSDVLVEVIVSIFGKRLRHFAKLDGQWMTGHFGRLPLICVTHWRYPTPMPPE